MQKTPRSPWSEKGWRMCQKDRSQQKKETGSLSAVTGEVTTLKFFLLLVVGPMRLFLGGTLVNLSTSSSRLFYQWPTTKSTK